jgi:hypothetical protein
MNWEEYVLLDEQERAAARIWFVIGLWEGEVRALMLSLALSLCGVGWDEEYGGLRRIP